MQNLGKTQIHQALGNFGAQTQPWFYVYIEDVRINFGLENVGLQKIEIPELSLSPRCMLGPVRHRLCRVLLVQPF
jgi:hypothetical protein